MRIKDFKEMQFHKLRKHIRTRKLQASVSRTAGIFFLYMVSYFFFEYLVNFYLKSHSASHNSVNFFLFAYRSIIVSVVSAAFTVKLELEKEE